MCMNVLPSCMFMHHVHAGTSRGQKKVSVPLELTSLVSVSCHAGARNETPVLF